MIAIINIIKLNILDNKIRDIAAIILSIKMITINMIKWMLTIDLKKTEILTILKSIFRNINLNIIQVNKTNMIIQITMKIMDKKNKIKHQKIPVDSMLNKAVKALQMK